MSGPGQESWRVAAGDASYVLITGVAKPIACGSTARARLIAAAPDLLDFAQSMVVALDLAAELFPADAIHFAQFADDARAVLSKAQDEPS